HWAYLGQKGPVAVDTALVLGQFGKSPAQAYKAYRKFIEDGRGLGTRNTITGQSTSDFWAMRSSFNGFPSGLRKARSDHADPKYNLRHCCMQWRRFTIVKRKN